MSTARDASWEDILAEMNDKSQMEDLRQHLKFYNLFPRGADPDSAPIKMEYLQKLARQWKLHHKRGFWKEHSSQSQLVIGLHQHHVALLHSSAKAKAARQAAKVQEEGKEGGVGSPEKEALVSRPPPVIAPTAASSSSMFAYAGDKFGTRGDYVQGTVYLSRFQAKLSVPDEPVKRTTLDSDVRPSGTLVPLFPEEDSDDGNESEDGVIVVDSAETAKNLALALCNFSTSPGFHPKILAAGAATSLVDTWNTCEDGMKDDVAVALCQLASDTSKTRLIEDGALPAILSLATARKPENQQLCSSTLALLSSVEDNVIVLLLEGGLLALESLAVSSDAGTRLLAAVVMRNLASMKAHRALMVKDDAIKTLIPLSQDAMADTRRNAAVALSYLCSHKRSQPKALADNVAVHMLRLAKSEDPETKSCAAQGLCALTHNKPTRAKLVKDGVLPHIVRQAGSDDLILQQKAASALLWLSLEEGPVRAEILNMAIPVLLRLANSPNEKTRRCCAMALCNVLCQPEAQHRILELDALGAFKALVSCPEEEIQQKAASTLLALVSSGPDVASAVVAKDGLLPILSLTNAPSFSIKLTCTSALQSLSVSPANHLPLVEAGVVERITELVTLPDDRFKLGGAQILTNLTCSVALHPILKEKGVLPLLLRLSSFDVANSFAAIGLCNFTANKDMRRFLIDNGAVQILIGLAKSTSESTKQECCRAICNLSSLAGSEQIITTSGGAAGLIMVALFRSDTAETKGICASALLNLMTQPVCREQLIKEDVVWVLIKLAAADDSNDDTRSVCGRAICSLSYNPKGCVKLLEHKAIPAIYTLCRDGDAKTKRYASITLSNLSAYGATHNLMLGQGAVSCLVELADTVDAETRLHAVGALCNLSVAAGNRSQMISQRAAIALNLSKCANQETMRRCALALVNLSSELELQSEFVAQGALVGLLQLCTEGSPLIKVLCARALYNLSFDPFSREALVKANALPSLVTLSFSDHEYTVGLCSITFFNLAGQASCQAAVCDGEGVLQAISHIMVTCPIPDAVRASYSSLASLATSKQYHASLLESGAVKALVSLTASSSDPELVQVCARVLRNVSFSSACRAKLADCGGSTTAIRYSTFSSSNEVRDDCIVTLCNLVKDDTLLESVVRDGAVKALNTATKSASGEIQRLISGAYVYVSRPAELREMVASDGMLESLSLLLRSELDDVKKMCSTSVRNLSNSASVQAKMVDMGMIALLIDVMSVKDDSRRSPGAVSLPKSGLLPSPIQDWQPGRPAEAIAQIVVPAFPEVAAPPLLEPAEQPVDAQLTGDLGSARGLFQASALSVVALGEPLWTKLDVGDMSTSSPTMPAPLVLLPPGTAPNPKASSSVVDHTADVGTPAPASGPPAPEPDVDEELVFDFKLSSPSSEFYKKQASRGPRTVMSFDPQYSKLRSPTSTLPQLAVKSPGTLGRSPSGKSPANVARLPKV